MPPTSDQRQQTTPEFTPGDPPGSYVASQFASDDGGAADEPAAQGLANRSFGIDWAIEFG